MYSEVVIKRQRAAAVPAGRLRDTAMAALIYAAMISDLLLLLLLI